MFVFICSLSAVSAENNPIDSSKDLSTEINKTADGDTLILEEGIYDKANDRGIIINNSITIKGNPLTNDVIIDAKGQDRIFTINSDINVTFISITFINGYVADDGGAIYCNAGTLNFIDCKFIDNTADNGGAIYNSGATVTVKNSMFSNNKATGKGGGIYNGATCNMSVSGNDMNFNVADVSGNAIYNEGNMGILTLTYITKTVADGKTIKLTAFLTDDMGNPVTGGNIAFYVGDVYVDTATSVEGIASCDFPVTASSGDAPVNGTYDGNGDYSIDMTEGLLTYSDEITVTSTIVLPEKFVFGKKVVITGVLTDADDNPVAGVKLTVTIGGKESILTTDENGKWTLEYTPDSVDTFTIEVSIADDELYADFDNSTTFEVNKASTTSTIVVGKLYVNKLNTITGIALDENGNPLADVELKITIGGEEKTVRTGDDGTWSVDYTPTDIGPVAIFVTWDGNETHINLRTDNKMGTVTKISTNTTITAPNTKARENSIISGFVTDEDGNRLPGVAVTITINGKEHTVVTDSNGVWSLDYPTEVGGNFNVLVVWNGDETYDGFENNTNLAVSKLNASSTIVTTNATVGKNTTINGVVKDGNNATLANVNLTVTIAGVSYKVTTNSAGAWSLTYLPNAAGNLNVVVTWAGNTLHSGFSVSDVLKVNSATSTSTNIKISNKYTKKIKKNVYRKTINFKNYGQKTGSKKFTINVNKKYKIINVAKSKNISYTYNKKTNKLTVTVKNLAYNKISKIKYRLAKK
jgi:predicted outer membrane repeat protein